VSKQESARGLWDRAHKAAVVIEEARELAVPRLSKRQAAKRAGMSDAWWAASVRGSRKITPEHEIEVTPPDDTLVRMARAVGVEREVREILGLEIPDRLIARGPEDDPAIEVTLRVPPEEYHQLTPEGRAYIDALVRRMAAEEHRLSRPAEGEQDTGRPT
jgi:hypothetical protein